MSPTVRSGVAACLASVVLMGAGTPAAQAEVDRPEVRAAAAAGGCELDRRWPFGATVEDWTRAPGRPLKVVASLNGEPDRDTVGTLCVSLLRQDSTALVREATLQEVIKPPTAIEPTTDVDLSIDSMPFRFSPSEAAIAVQVTSGISTTSVLYSRSTLYLLRVQGDRLVKIFEEDIAETDIDKVGSGRDRGFDHILKFTAHQTRGAYDLIVATRRGRQLHKYVWNGREYK